MHGYDHAFPLFKQRQEELCADEVCVRLGCVFACVDTVDAGESMACCWVSILFQLIAEGGVMGWRMPCSWDEEYGWLGVGHCGEWDTETSWMCLD